MRNLCSCLMFWVAAVGCANEDEVTLLDPDDARAGDVGREGPFGVMRSTRALSSDDGSVDADVYRPFLDGDAAVPAAPPLVFLQGGFVATDRYAWIARHTASRGFVALVPHHAFDLAFFSQDAAARALAGARAAEDDDALFGLVDTERALFAGHSLGGVVAAKAWLAEEGADLVLLASEPDPGDDFEGRAGRVLSIVGSRDAKETVADAEEGAKAFDAATVIVVDGMNHYQLTDDATEGELSSDGVPDVDTEDAQQIVVTFMDAALDDLAGLAPYPFTASSSWPVGSAPP